MIKTVIIDDDPNIRETLKTILNDYFTEIEVIGMADSVSGGVELIKRVNPDLVLLDIEIKEGTGFQVLQRLKPFSFKFIVITAFNDCAIKAIKFSALDYILKPVNEHELRLAVENALAVIENSDLEQQVNNFFEHYERKTQSKKIVLKTAENLYLIDVSDIIHCKSDNSYTTFYLQSGEEILVSKSIKDYEEILTDYRFFRPHQSFLVNLNFVKRVDKSDGGFLIMKNGEEIPISSRRKAALVQILESL